MNSHVRVDARNVRLESTEDGEFTVLYKDQPLALIVIPAAITNPEDDGYWAEASPVWTGPLDHLTKDEFLIGTWSTDDGNFKRLFKDKLTGETC